MRKIHVEDKIQAVKRYIEGNESLREIAQSIGIDKSEIRYWVQRYRYHGENGFKKPCTSYSVQFKLDVIHYMIDENTSLRDTAARFNLTHHSTLRRWVNAYREEGTDALSPIEEGRPYMKQNPENKKKPSVSEIELQKEIDFLRMENAYFKKVKCLSSGTGKTTKENKAQVVYELRHRFTVSALLQLAELARSTYYNLVKRWDRPDPDATIKQLILSIYHEHKGRYGYRRIQMELRCLGHIVNHKKVQRIMKMLNLTSLVRIKKYRSYKGKVGKTAPNILERDFRAKQPNQKWVTDITEFKLFGSKFYLSPMLDLFNGEIIAYTLGSRPTYVLVDEMLNQSLQTLTNQDQLIIHSDQGWHYQMKPYQNTLSENGITQSMSRKGNCYDNAVIESFFGTFKSEFLYLQEFENREQFTKELAEYISYYNSKRIKSKLGMSPIEYRTHHQLSA
ncbi:IS3 family transposase [Sporosarcina sp. P7]|uniref:IS3 family transposase n=1 Tax=Sporosarcina sp. P7 TaxID=2048244 RepID=UPI000C165A13|nr:IS3 family transposase [Sporosarcina sp. P7]PID23323.1 IS3 family transposase [Sporosarcina sp. P7]